MKPCPFTWKAPVGQQVGADVLWIPQTCKLADGHTGPHKSTSGCLSA